MNLLETQRRMAAALRQQLTSGGHMARRTPEGASMAGEAAAFIRPNDRLTAVERLEIYSRSYWFRLLDSLRDDFPGLLAVVGSTTFDRLSRAYLSDCPSRSFTLRDLGSRLPQWLAEHPEQGGRKPDLAQDMARLEWAHIEAFDGPANKTPGVGDLPEFTPSQRLGLQPYISLLELRYPVDELRIHVNADREGAETASNFVVTRALRAIRKAHRLPQKQIFVAVHRLDLSVYYRRLSAEEFRLLSALRAGQQIGRAIGKAFLGSSIPPEDVPALLQLWFAAWAEFGWLTE